MSLGCTSSRWTSLLVVLHKLRTKATAFKCEINVQVLLPIKSIVLRDLLYRLRSTSFRTVSIIVLSSSSTSEALAVTPASVPLLLSCQ